MDFNAKYYYDNIIDKLEESLSVSNCTISSVGGRTKLHHLAPANRDKADLEIEMLPPQRHVMNEWQKLRSSLSGLHFIMLVRQCAC